MALLLAVGFVFLILDRNLSARPKVEASTESATS
jgi:hypothetical protein